MVLRLCCVIVSVTDGGTGGHHPETFIYVLCFLCASPPPVHRQHGTHAMLSPNGQWVWLFRPRIYHPGPFFTKCVAGCRLFRMEAIPSVALAHSKAGPSGNQRSRHLGAEDDPVRFCLQYRREFRPKNGKKVTQSSKWSLLVKVMCVSGLESHPSCVT